MGGLKEPLRRDVCVRLHCIYSICVCKKPFTYVRGTLLHSSTYFKLSLLAFIFWFPRRGVFVGASLQIPCISLKKECQ